MTEQEWIACDHPLPMLEFLRDRMTMRQRLLFETACCRRVWALLPDERSRKAVEIAEVFAEDRRLARNKSAQKVFPVPTIEDGILAWAEEKPLAKQLRKINEAAYDVWQDLSQPLAEVETTLIDQVHSSANVQAAWVLAAAAMAAYSVGEPTFAPGAGVSCAARQAAGDINASSYSVNSEDELSPERQAHAELLPPGPHVRGCWALDLILGKS